MKELIETENADTTKKQGASLFGRRLRALRIKKDISMDELALAVGSTKSAISRYENGLVSPTLETARKFADYFMVTVDWLGGGDSDDEMDMDIPHKYFNAVRYAMKNNVTAEQVQAAVDFALVIRGEQ